MDSNLPEESGPPEAGPEAREFHLDTSRSEPKFDYLRVGAGIAAGVLVISAIVFSVTDVSEYLVPMEERYLAVLIPATEDGSEPFTLDELENEVTGNSISVAGRMTNMSLEEVENVIAVIEVRDTTQREPAVLEAPVSPAILMPGESGEFSSSVTARARPTGFSVKFRLQDGPHVPHRDARATPFELVLP